MRIAVTIALSLAVGSFATAHAQQPLTDKEKADAAEKSIAAMTEVIVAVDALVEEARGERDALRLNCVNERKSQISGLVKVAELALEELRAAAKERQSEAVEHEYGKIQIARGKVDGYKTEAQQCIGLLAFYAGDEVEREFTDDNQDTPRLDPTRPTPLAPASFRAPPASPLR